MANKQFLILKAQAQLYSIEVLCAFNVQKQWKSGDPSWIFRAPDGKFGGKNIAQENISIRSDRLLSTVSNDVKSFLSRPSVKKGFVTLGILGLGVAAINLYSVDLDIKVEDEVATGLAAIKDDDELLAKVLAYTNASNPLDPLRQEIGKELHNRGIEIKDSIDNPETGFKAWIVDKVKSNTSTLVFCGTELDANNVADIKDDLIGDIGGIQYAYGKNYIESYLLEASRTGKKTELVGHSLGGAIAQMAAIDYKVQKVNTFNSPGIPKEYQEKIDKIKIKQQVVHHITEDDIVSTGGDIFLPGKVKIQKSLGNLFENHVGLIGEEVDYPFDKLNSENYKASFITRSDQRLYRETVQPAFLKLFAGIN